MKTVTLKVQFDCGQLTSGTAYLVREVENEVDIDVEVQNLSKLGWKSYNKLGERVYVPPPVKVYYVTVLEGEYIIGIDGDVRKVD